MPNVFRNIIDDTNWHGYYHKARWMAEDAYSFIKSNLSNASVSGLSALTQLDPEQVRNEIAWFRGQGRSIGTSISQNRSIRALRSYSMSSVHKSGMEFAKSTFGLQKGAGIIERGLGFGFAGISAYHGYRKGGISGAVGSVATDFAINYGIGAVTRALSLGPAVIGGIGAVALGGAFGLMTGDITFSKLASPWINTYMKKHAELEMSTPIKDDFGMVSTMRQRSLRAIQNSRLNGRSALGNEAALMYSPYYR